MNLKRSSDLLNKITISLFIHKDNCMRITHRNAGHFKIPAVYGNCLTNNLSITISCYRNRRTIEDRFTHINGYTFHNAVFDIKLRYNNSRPGFYPESFLIAKASLVGILGKHSYAISAHFGLTAVRIYNSHAEIIYIDILRRQYQNYAISTYTEVTVTELYSHLIHIILIRQFILHIDEKDEIIAAAMPFSKSQTFRHINRLH